MQLLPYCIETMNFLWYDYETYGLDPTQDRIAQFASIRTDENLNQIGEECSIFSDIPDDYLPSPYACIVHGFTPDQTADYSLKESIFANKIFDILNQQETCVVGFNNNSFDDEFTRFLFYRNLLDPYSWHYRNGNSRWDIVNLARTTSAIYPSAINVKSENDGFSFKLQDLARVNNIESSNAHNALSDVHTTISLARLIKNNAPDIFNASFRIRSKKAVKIFIKSNRLKPLIYTSQFIKSKFKSTTVVVPICRHPLYPDYYISIDLKHDLSKFVNHSFDQIKDFVFTNKDPHANPFEFPRFHVIKLARCPSLYEFSLFSHDLPSRLGFGNGFLDSQVSEVRCMEDRLIEVINNVFTTASKGVQDDAEAQLYEGFISDTDRHLCSIFINSLANRQVPNPQSFEDIRLQVLSWRYLNRNFSELRTNQKSLDKWREYVNQKLFLKVTPHGQSIFDENKSSLLKCLEEAKTMRDQQIVESLLKRSALLQDTYCQI